ncbi:hypothetical protein BO79DRAFT_150127 [Aspergillus costaricaensis CBS 115574]|uniref:Uncharacterized protein n=1 Tax=Aspergillus costaricaensis CBS 115574 TaxID=1448317 RepID=A0ACD1ID18_9EURO|nr:hypothetical protein BO79DRAFT_150127 [Aspergillus costaricaensis CBS 115574]RAK87901.1 hypothetical protein BO79DRAFT_150127 [Aspergillus costaricaensis CBS 115574]
MLHPHPPAPRNNRTHARAPRAPRGHIQSALHAQPLVHSQPFSRGQRHHPVNSRGGQSHIYQSQRGRPRGQMYTANFQPSWGAPNSNGAPGRSRSNYRGRRSRKKFAANTRTQNTRHLTTMSTAPFFNLKRPSSNSTEGKAVAQIPSPFQRLPPEIRDQIYEHIFEPHRVELIRRSEKDPTKHPKRVYYRLYHNQLRSRNPITQQIQDPSRKTQLPVPIALVFTCRSIYCDTLWWLYSTTQFVFTSTKTMNRFFNTIPSEVQPAIRHVEINQEMHSEPSLTEHRIHKVRSDWAFTMACENLVRCCSGLQVLYIYFRIRDWPMSLEIGETWSLPMMAFAEYKGKGGLDVVTINLDMPRFGVQKLKNMAKILEKRFMKPKAFQIREDERLARELSCSFMELRVEGND